MGLSFIILTIGLGAVACGLKARSGLGVLLAPLGWLVCLYGLLDMLAPGFWAG